MPLLILVFIVVPLIELYVIIKVGGSIGIGPTIFLLLLDSIIGSLLLRAQGRAAWVAFNRALAENRMPHNEVLNGVLIIFGGALLLTPGFITDIFGLVLLIPPTRAVVRGFLKRFTVGRLTMGPRAAMWGYDRVRDGRTRRAGAPGAGPQEGERPPRRPRPVADDDFSWTSPQPGASARRADDIEGEAREVRDDDSLPPGERGSFPG